MASSVPKLEDNICPICMYILIQPVTMPCKHELCFVCFKQNVEGANFCCPLCRTRISTWTRRASRNKSLVNENRWEEIQELFPEKVKRRMNGEEDDDEIDALSVSIRLAEPGEIRNEYEEQLRKLRDQRVEERRQEQEASEALIRQLQEEEAKARADLDNMVQQDKELAEELSAVNNNDHDDVFVRESRRNSRSTSSTSSTSNCRSIEPFLNKMTNAGMPRESPYPYPCYTPTAAGKLVVDKAKVKAMEDKFQKQKVTLNADKVSITTQDVMDIERKMILNSHSAKNLCSTMITVDSSSSGTDSSMSMRMPSLSETNLLNQCEILDQMSGDLDIDMSLPDLTDSRSNTRMQLNAEVQNTIQCEINSNHGESLIEPPQSSSTLSNDSISAELSHFRPIRACPLTPPRKLPSGKFVTAPLIRTTPRNLSKTSIISPPTSLSDIDASSPIMQRRLSELAEERKYQVERMSKSTATIPTSADDNENRNPQTENTLARLQPIHRIAQFQDISNSPGRNHNGDITDDLSVSPIVKKFIIPLEPNLDEDDDVIICSPCDFIPRRKVGEKLNLRVKTGKNRKRTNSSRNGCVRKSSGEVDFGSSPQRSITHWIVKQEPVPCVDIKPNFDVLLANNRDEVDGAMVVRNRNNSADSETSVPAARGRTSSRSRNTLDGFVKKDNSSSDKLHTMRKRRKLRLPDYVYNDPANVSQSMNKVKDVLSKLSFDSDSESCANELCSDGESNIIEDFVLDKRKRKNPRNTVKPDNSKRRRTTANLKTNKSSLKTSKQVLKQSKTGVNHSENSRNSINNYFLPKQQRRKTCAYPSSVVNNESCKSDGVEIVLDQEEQDRLLALELQKQFEFEAKFRLNSVRIRGTADGYSFRRRNASVPSS